LGVIALWVHKQVETSEIGHTALHGTFNRLEGVRDLHARGFKWDVPIDEKAWKYAHNFRHHIYTNIAGKDPDIHYGHCRLSAETPHHWFHWLQLPYLLLLVTPSFAALMNLQNCGGVDFLGGNYRPERFDFIKDRSPASLKKVLRTMFRKYFPYYLK